MTGFYSSSLIISYSDRYENESLQSRQTTFCGVEPQPETRDELLFWYPETLFSAPWMQSDPTFNIYHHRSVDMREMCFDL